MSLLKLSEMNMFRDLAQTFSLERDAHILRDDIKAFFCDDHRHDAIQILGNYGIREGDWLIESSTGKRCFIEDLRPITSDEFIARYKTERQMQESARPVSLNIGNIYGPAIVGSQSNAVIHSGASFDDIRQFLSQQNLSSSDRAELEALTKAVEAVVQNQLPANSGIFSRYLSIAEKYSGLVSLILQPLMASLFQK